MKVIQSKINNTKLIGPMTGSDTTNLFDHEQARLYLNFLAFKQVKYQLNEKVPNYLTMDSDAQKL